MKYDNPLMMTVKEEESDNIMKWYIWLLMTYDQMYEENEEKQKSM